MSFALFTIADFIMAGFHDGWTLLINAATPVTMGVAIEVPLNILNVEPKYVELISTPGATTSGLTLNDILFGPFEEKRATVSDKTEAPTVMASSAVPGLLIVWEPSKK